MSLAQLQPQLVSTITSSINDISSFADISTISDISIISDISNIPYILKDIEEYKTEWFKQVEEDSKNLYKVAEDAIKQKSNIKVLLLKRPQRFDRGAEDIIGIKQKLSEYANQILDNLWLKSGSPEKIHIAELKLGTKENVHLRKLIFGASSIENFDGVHLCGPGAARHFTYRSVQAIKEVLPKSEKMRAMADKSGARPSYRRTGLVVRIRVTVQRITQTVRRLDTNAAIQTVHRPCTSAARWPGLALVNQVMHR